MDTEDSAQLVDASSADDELARVVCQGRLKCGPSAPVEKWTTLTVQSGDQAFGAAARVILEWGGLPPLSEEALRRVRASLAVLDGVNSGSPTGAS